MITSDGPLPPGLLLFDDRFRLALGTFHASWATIDATTDFAITTFLGVSHVQGHMLTCGMVFGAKARLLSSLIKRSNHKNRVALMTAFNWIHGHNKRDIIVHGYIITSTTEVSFIERPRGGNFRAKEHSFTLESFIDHTQELGARSLGFWTAMDSSREELQAFVEAASSLDSKS